jgi:hypothetical protein
VEEHDFSILVRGGLGSPEACRGSMGNVVDEDQRSYHWVFGSCLHRVEGQLHRTIPKIVARDGYTDGKSE